MPQITQRELDRLLEIETLMNQLKTKINPKTIEAISILDDFLDWNILRVDGGGRSRQPNDTRPTEPTG